MKKLLMGSVALTVFSISIIIFQMSCKKDATAQTGGTNYTLPAATTSSLGGIIVGSGLSVATNGTVSINNPAGGIIQLNKIVYSKQQFNSSKVFIGSEIWTANYDGTSQLKVNIILPSGIVFGEDPTPKLSPDGQKLFFIAGPASTNNSTLSSITSIYSSDVSGSNVLKIVDGTATNHVAQVSAY